MGISLMQKFCRCFYVFVAMFYVVPVLSLEKASRSHKGSKANLSIVIGDSKTCKGLYDADLDVKEFDARTAARAASATRSEPASPTLLKSDYSKNVGHRRHGYSLSDLDYTLRIGGFRSRSNQASVDKLSFSARDTKSLCPGAATVSAKSMQNAKVYERPCDSSSKVSVDVTNRNVLKKEWPFVLSFETVSNVIQFYAMPLLSAKPDVIGYSQDVRQQWLQ